MLSKSLIQFSVDGWFCVPSLLFDLRANCGQEVMKIMVTSFKRPHACTTTLSAPNPAAGHHPHRKVQDILLWGYCSFLLGPGAHKVLFLPFKLLLPQFCTSSGGSMVGLMETFFILVGSKITADGDCSHDIKRCLI